MPNRRRVIRPPIPIDGLCQAALLSEIDAQSLHCPKLFLAMSRTARLSDASRCSMPTGSVPLWNLVMRLRWRSRSRWGKAGVFHLRIADVGHRQSGLNRIHETAGIGGWPRGGTHPD
jgi:hypothetical protein